MKIFVTGKDSSGKSTFVNGLFNGRIEADIDGGQSSDIKVITFSTESAGTLTVYDTPGQELNATSHLQWIQQSCSDVQIVFFCIKMNDQFRPEDQQALASLTKTFNDMAMWSRVVVILTHANQVKKVFQRRESDETYYNGILSSMSRDIKTALGRITNSSIVVPIVPVGVPQDFSLPGGCSDWRSAVINACSTIGAPGTTLLKQVIEDDSLNPCVSQAPHIVSHVQPAAHGFWWRIGEFFVRLCRSEPPLC